MKYEIWNMKYELKKKYSIFFQKSQQLSIGYNAAIDSYIDAVVD